MSWAQALEDIRLGEGAPEGWSTEQQVRAELGFSSRDATKRFLDKAIAKGIAETQKFSVWSGRTVQAVSHYRLKP